VTINKMSPSQPYSANNIINIKSSGQRKIDCPSNNLWNFTSSHGKRRNDNQLCWTDCKMRVDANVTKIASQGTKKHNASKRAVSYR